MALQGTGFGDRFRIERIATSKVLAEHFSPDRGRFLTEWRALRKHRPDPQH